MQAFMSICSQAKPTEHVRESMKGVSTSTKGFTLVEAAVSLAILALALAAIYQSFAWSLSRTAVLNDQQTAIAVAQSVIDDMRSRSALRIGEMHGSANGTDWQVTTREHTSSTSTHSFPIFDVVVQITWGRSHLKHLQISSVEVGWPQGA